MIIISDNPYSVYSGKARKCSVGFGLQSETEPLLPLVIDHPGLLSCSSNGYIELYFNTLPHGWVRDISAPSLATLESKALRAQTNGTQYEYLGYGLESSSPPAEYADPLAATQAAKVIADTYGKKLMMAPGYRLMSDHEDLYAPMAALSDAWMFQTQACQVNDPGPAYTACVSRVLAMLRAGNPDIKIFAQITFTPDRLPDANRWLDYRRCIMKMVDATYIGVYVWDVYDPDHIRTQMELIYTSIYG